LQRLRNSCLQGIAAAEAKIEAGQSSAQAWIDHFSKRLSGIDTILKNLL
jgi:hypothetical protein